MPGFNTERNTRFGRVMAVGRVVGFWVLLTGTPAQAAVSESAFPAIQLRQELRPQEKAISSNQVAIMQYNTGHRSGPGRAEAQFNLGLFYAEGTGVNQDPSEAVKWWGMAAKQGLAAAQFNLGLMYMKGGGIEGNQEEAVRLGRLS